MCLCAHKTFSLNASHFGLVPLICTINPSHSCHEYARHKDQWNIPAPPDDISSELRNRSNLSISTASADNGKGDSRVFWTLHCCSPKCVQTNTQKSDQIFRSARRVWRCVNLSVGKRINVIRSVVAAYHTASVAWFGHSRNGASSNPMAYNNNKYTLRAARYNFSFSAEKDYLPKPKICAARQKQKVLTVKRLRCRY